ncbi:MAG: hypothetical protein QMD09_11965 [Desulfatibacillaceae bacterium]|nr:hypothetical protein [Desulfatibacillaceae bacterium]
MNRWAVVELLMGKDFIFFSHKPAALQAAAVNWQKLSLAFPLLKQDNHITGKGKSLFKSNQGFKLAQGSLLHSVKMPFPAMSYYVALLTKNRSAHRVLQP